MNRKTSLILVWVLVLVALVATGGIFAFNIYYDYKRPNFSRTSEIYIYPDHNVDSLLHTLRHDCGTLSQRSIDRIFHDIQSKDLKPGHYTITAKNPTVYVRRMLENGWQTPVKLVLEGSMRTKGTIARKIGNQMLLDSATAMKALCDSALLAGFGYDTENVFALIFPATYEVYWTDSMASVLKRNKAAHDSFWTEARKAKAKAKGLSEMEVAIVASIVNGESNHVPEYENIAGVYLNRLHKGMLLQADPTVAFCFDYKPNRILNEHLKIDSPYNTYKYKGLPPAPIRVPTKEALDAVLDAPEHKYLYFCASPELNGTHRFTGSYIEHLRNAAAFRRAIRERESQRKAAGK